MQRGEGGLIKSSVTSKNLIFAMPGFAAGGTAEQEQNKRYTMKSIKRFSVIFCIYLRDDRESEEIIT